MKIKRILVYKIDLPLREGGYSFSSGRSIKSYDSTIVRIETDQGLFGRSAIHANGPMRRVSAPGSPSLVLISSGSIRLRSASSAEQWTAS